MTLKEELEILRGEPIEVFDGDPMDIPCVETSDAEKLCRNPVVSVNMITYNHEPYIRQAIEGVMMQKTDFEFELVIGEDCSQDKTREICFEYQKKYPDKIRVLWWHENVSKIGGNSRRVYAHCRGEFIALCEGDDYWIDPQKLQKQVDVMRANPNVGLCFCGAKLLHDQENRMEDWQCAAFKPGVITGRLFLLYTMFGQKPELGRGSEGFVMTAGLMLKSDINSNMRNKYEIFRWKLPVGDTSLVLGAASLSDVYYIKEQVSVYRITKTGSMSTNGLRVCRDSSIIRMYFSVEVLKCRYYAMPLTFMRQHLYLLISLEKCSGARRISRIFSSLLVVKDLKQLLLSMRFLPLTMFGRLGFINTLSLKCCGVWWKIMRKPRLNRQLMMEYTNQGVQVC